MTLQPQPVEENHLLGNGNEVNDHEVAAGSVTAEQFQKQGQPNAYLFTIGEDDLVAVAEGEADPGQQQIIAANLTYQPGNWPGFLLRGGVIEQIGLKSAGQGDIVGLRPFAASSPGFNLRVYVAGYSQEDGVHRWLLMVDAQPAVAQPTVGGVIG